MKYIFFAIVVAAIVFSSFSAFAAYPFITDLPNVVIGPNSSSGVIKFRVSDSETPASGLVVTYQSNNPALVPNSDDNIQLGGSGSDRTLVITPLPDSTGTAVIFLTVTDSDGDTNQDSIRIQVVSPPRI